MHKTTPQQLAEDILERSKCAVQVGAVIADRHGIFAWGWNNEGDGYGRCAEQHAISRANWSRLPGASIYIAGKRKRSLRAVKALPCFKCWRSISCTGISRIYWRDKDEEWRLIKVGEKTLDKLYDRVYIDINTGKAA